jgi:hypothetical protein
MYRVEVIRVQLRLIEEGTSLFHGTLIILMHSKHALIGIGVRVSGIGGLRCGRDIIVVQTVFMHKGENGLQIARCRTGLNSTRGILLK